MARFNGVEVRLGFWSWVLRASAVAMIATFPLWAFLSWLVLREGIVATCRFTWKTLWTVLITGDPWS